MAFAVTEGVTSRRSGGYACSMRTVPPLFPTLAGLVGSLALAGCPSPERTIEIAPSQQAPMPEVPQPEVAPMYGFSWVEADLLAAMPRPRGDDLLEISEAGVDLLISLTETPLAPADLDAAGLDTLHLPIEDFHPPTMEQMEAFVDAVEARELAGEQVGVHCTAGRGRSGTLVAVWFVHTGMTSDEAIATIRSLRPGSIETTEQEQAVHDWYAEQEASNAP